MVDLKEGFLPENEVEFLEEVDLNVKLFQGVNLCVDLLPKMML